MKFLRTGEKINPHISSRTLQDTYGRGDATGDAGNSWSQNAKAKAFFSLGRSGGREVLGGADVSNVHFTYPKMSKWGY